MAFTARPAVDCSTFTAHPSLFAGLHLGPSPIWADTTDDELRDATTRILSMLVAVDDSDRPVVPESRPLLWNATFSMVNELGERALWPPHVAAADDAIEAHLERMSGL